MESINRAHAITVQRNLGQFFAFAELETRTMELIDLCEECTRIGLNLAEMAAQLDILCDHTTDRSAKRQRGLADAASQSGPLLDVSHFDAARAQLLLTCAGTYCTVLGRSAMALEHFRAATSMVATTPPAAAQLGLAKSLLALGHRQQALSVVLSFWRSPQQSHLERRAITRADAASFLAGNVRRGAADGDAATPAA